MQVWVMSEYFNSDRHLTIFMSEEKCRQAAQLLVQNESEHDNKEVVKCPGLTEFNSDCGVIIELVTVIE